MQRFLKIVIPILLVFNTISLAQVIDEGYEVATWQNFRSSAVTHTFDDNEPNQMAVVVPMFNEFNYNITLFAPTGSWIRPNWSDLLEASSQGHEVASHTITHPHLNTMSDEEQLNELKAPHDEIMEKIPGQSALTLAYPFCERGNSEIDVQFYIAARGCSGQVERSTPNNMMNISSMVVGTEGSIQTTDNLNSKVESAVSRNGWALFLIHGIDGDGGWSDVSSSEIRGHLEYMKANDNKFWVETFGSIVRYIRERDDATVTEISTDESSIIFEATDNLEDSVYNYPLTIRREMPQDWPFASATQNGDSLDIQIIEIDSVKYIMLDVIPDGGNIILEKSEVTGIQETKNDLPEEYFLIRNYPNPFNPTTTIVYNVPQSGQVKLEIYNMLGEKLKTLVNQFKNNGQYSVIWNASNYSSGTYLYKYETNNTIVTEKMTLVK